MNRFFASEPFDTLIPRRCYARLDQTEPQDVGDAREAVFAFEAVNGGWLQFEPGARYDLRYPDAIHANESRFWAEIFARMPGERRPFEDPFDDAPLVRLEFTLDRESTLFSSFLELGEAWLEFELEPYDPAYPARQQVDVFGGLFAAPIQAHLARSPGTAPSEALDAVFNMTTWPDASAGEIEAALTPICAVAHASR